MFSCEFCEISKTTFFTEHLWATASLSRMLILTYFHQTKKLEQVIRIACVRVCLFWKCQWNEEDISRTARNFLMKMHFVKSILTLSSLKLNTSYHAQNQNSYFFHITCNLFTGRASPKNNQCLPLFNFLAFCLLRYALKIPLEKWSWLVTPSAWSRKCIRKRFRI